MTLEVRWHSQFSDFPETAWEGLRSEDRNPFLSYAFLNGLEKMNSIRQDLGWIAHHLGVWEGSSLVAAAPGYIKLNSHGEFVFDHAWAHAYERYGREYYPKQLFAIPYSPVTGPRWFASSPHSLDVLLAAMQDIRGVSSTHVNFLEASALTFYPSTWLHRVDIQYHWHRDPAWSSFDDFLASMDHKHRKNIRQERRKVSDAGIMFRVVSGDAITHSDIEHAYEFYLQTFAEYGNYPALTFEFFEYLREHAAESLVLILAQHGEEVIAGAVCLRSDDTLYGRYWGSHVDVAGLHFETCYYQGIEYCLSNGLKVFEPGAQGVHKIARGFLPTSTHSVHWINDEAFRGALANWCKEANDEMRDHTVALMKRSPFK